MVKKRLIESTVMVTFMICIALILFYGFKHFAGFQYASPLDQSIISLLGITLFLCLLYFAYRFLAWLVKIF